MKCRMQFGTVNCGTWRSVVYTEAGTIMALLLCFLQRPLLWDKSEGQTKSHCLDRTLQFKILMYLDIHRRRNPILKWRLSSPMKIWKHRRSIGIGTWCSSFIILDTDNNHCLCNKLKDRYVAWILKVTGWQMRWTGCRSWGACLDWRNLVEKWRF